MFFAIRKNKHGGGERSSVHKPLLRPKVGEIKFILGIQTNILITVLICQSKRQTSGYFKTTMMKLRRYFLQSVMVTATIIAVVYLSIADNNNCCKKISVYSDRYNNNKLKSLEFFYLMDFSLYPTDKSTNVWHSNLVHGSLGL